MRTSTSRRSRPAAAALRLREAVAAADALAASSPPVQRRPCRPLLKNAIDWLSRPYGAGPSSGKAVAVVGTAFGQYGGVWAHDDTRKSVGVASGFSTGPTWARHSSMTSSGEWEKTLCACTTSGSSGRKSRVRSPVMVRCGSLPWSPRSASVLFAAMRMSGEMSMP
ncbi:hypothetical protein SGLAM104S_09491 [Streptomyces glaucescens]